jgi:hypothetical protein
MADSGALDGRPPAPPGGVETLPSLDRNTRFETAVAAAQQQDGEGFLDPEFAVMTKSDRGRMESNGKVIYISGHPPSGSSSAGKVDTWSRMKAMRMAADDGGAGALLHLRPDHLNDCWLLSAIAMVSVRPELIGRIHHANPSLGVHAVRLYKDGEAKGVAPEWTTVVIDDQLPCHGKKKPVYSTNVDPGAGPVGAIQKALAKLYGCYEDLAGGRVGSALEDLTGGISDKLYLRDGLVGQAVSEASEPPPKQSHISVSSETAGGVGSAMWQRLDELLRNGHLIGATYKPKYAVDTDVVAMPIKATAPKKQPPSLAYPVTELKEVGGLGYVRLRNPWGKINETAAPEYKGDWGPASATWQNEQDVARALGGRPRDGSFWMSFEAFLSGFNKVYICYLPNHPSATIQQIEGEWSAESAGGRLSSAPGAKWRDNPQYRLTVSEKCTVSAPAAHARGQLLLTSDLTPLPQHPVARLLAPSAC